MTILASRQLHHILGWSMKVSADIALVNELWQSSLDRYLLPQLDKPGYNTLLT